MKIAITGHTSGIGKALHEVCKNVTDDFLLMSRSTGYNLKTSIEQIKKDIIDYDPDIIFNNAWYPGSQIALLKDLHELFKDEDKHIINTGSLTAYMIGMFDDKLGYAEEKAQIKDYCVLQSFSYPHANRCRVSNISVGFTDTEIVNKQEGLITTKFVAEKMFQIAFSETPIPETVINNKYLGRSQIIKCFKVASKNLIQTVESS